MSQDRKYIMLRNHEPVLFSPTMTHKEMAINCGESQVTSAGFYDITFKIIIPTGGNAYDEEPVLEVVTYGESKSLNMKPAKMDAFWIKKLLID